MIFSQNIRSSVVSVLSTSDSFIFRRWFPRFRFLGSALSATENNIYVCIYFQQAASYCSGQRAFSMWRKFPLVCSNYCLQRIAIPPEKRRGREKETKKKRLHSENNYFVPNCHSAPANKNFPSQRKMLGKVSAKRCIWDLAFKQVSCNISNFMNIGFGTFGRWHQE